MADTEQDVERLFNLVLSREEVLVVVYGLLAVDGLVHGRIDEAVRQMLMNYIALRVTTGVNLHAGVHRLEDKLRRLSDALEKDASR